MTDEKHEKLFNDVNMHNIIQYIIYKNIHR